MSLEQDTAYPRLKNHYSPKELEGYFTPDAAELALAQQHTKHTTSRLCFLALFKTAQYLGRFIPVSEIPKPIIRHLTSCLGSQAKRVKREHIRKYDRSGGRHRHYKILRSALGIHMFDKEAVELITRTALHAADTKEQVNDIINEVLEELVRHRFELPTFTLLQEAAVDAKKQSRKQLFAGYRQQLTPVMVRQLDQLLVVDDQFSLWHKYRRDCGKPTSKVIKEYLIWLTEVKEQAESLPELKNLSAARRSALFHEARSYDAKSMRRLLPDKRYTLTALLVRQRYATALDDVASIYIRMVRQLHHIAQQKYQEHLLKHSGDADKLIKRFHQVLTAWHLEEGMDTTDVDDLLDEDTELWINACEQHLKLADDNYYLDLRRTINQATNKCEEFNDFCKWLMFGGDGIIAENLRHEQQKVIKYNHLVSNLTILHNVQNMTQALKSLAEEGVEMTPEILTDLSPYRRKHINRFGDYRMDLDRPVPKLDYELTIPIKVER
ncbi:DUF4158 domain-containing protein [Endozoicomonas acroporae]|uniref:DUF4158 domain-containing protein n=1 Tax=Endozoicomonas acroporae TaxID=1701104 RepID=UPI003D7AFB98